jgi:hypothetical protein
MAATAHGSTAEKPRVGADTEPAGVPQRWAEAGARRERGGARTARRAFERGATARAEAAGRRCAARWTWLSPLRRDVGEAENLAAWSWGESNRVAGRLSVIPCADYLFAVTESRALLPDLKGATAKDVLELLRTLNVRFPAPAIHRHPRRQQERRAPASQFEKALAGDIMFDGSSIEGFVRIEESDMLLAPGSVDLSRVSLGRRRSSHRPADLRRQSRGRLALSAAIRAERSSACSPMRRRWATR